MKKALVLPLFVLASALARGDTFFHAFLSGPAETPPNASPGTGSALVTYDSTAHTLLFDVAFSGLLAGTTAAHIHAPTAVPGVGNVGVAVDSPILDLFPLGVTAGTYDHLYDLTSPNSYSPAFLTLGGGTPAGAEALLSASMEAGRSYFNIHTTAFPGGEIRGFLTPIIPEPGTWVSMISLGALAGTVITRRLRRSA